MSNRRLRVLGLVVTMVGALVLGKPTVLQAAPSSNECPLTGIYEYCGPDYCQMGYYPLIMWCLEFEGLETNPNCCADLNFCYENHCYYESYDKFECKFWTYDEEEAPCPFI